MSSRLAPCQWIVKPDFFLSFTEESGPEAMQHGNIAKDMSSSLLIVFVIVTFGMTTMMY